MAVDAGVPEGTLSMKGKGHVVDSYDTMVDSMPFISDVRQFNARSRTSLAMAARIRVEPQ
jgi:hypothetical protein